MVWILLCGLHLKKVVWNEWSVILGRGAKRREGARQSELIIVKFF